jgi:hypothetical protein
MGTAENILHPDRHYVEGENLFNRGYIHACNVVDAIEEIYCHTNISLGGRNITDILDARIA